MAGNEWCVFYHLKANTINSRVFSPVHSCDLLSTKSRDHHLNQIRDWGNKAHKKQNTTCVVLLMLLSFCTKTDWLYFIVAYWNLLTETLCELWHQRLGSNTIAANNSLVSNSTKPLPEPILTYCQQNLQQHITAFSTKLFLISIIEQ